MTNSTQRVKEHRERMVNLGLRRLPEDWIPNTPEAVARIKAYAKRLRDEHKREGNG